jgi:hypothetical protein
MKAMIRPDEISEVDLRENRIVIHMKDDNYYLLYLGGLSGSLENEYSRIIIAMKNHEEFFELIGYE